MRIAFIVNEFPVLSETFILNQVTGLIQRGHEVDIYAISERQPNNTSSKVHPDVETYDLLRHTYYFPVIPANHCLRVVKGLRLLSTNFSKDPLILLRSLNVFDYGAEAVSLKPLYRTIPFINKELYDIIHCQFGTVGLVGQSLRSIVSPGAKLITSFRGYDASKYIHRFGNNIYNRLFKTGDLFLANCEYFRRRLIRLGCDEKKITVHFSGIDCSRFRYSSRHLPADQRVQLITIGRLVEKKGIEYSIRAIAKLTKVNQNIEYNIMGDGPLKEDLQQLIQELDVGHIVKLLGWKQQQEIIEILNHAHILVAPSVTAQDGDQDAPVNTLKEAMAMGLPVVSTQHGGIPELVEDGISGFLVPEQNVDALAEKLGYLIRHPEVWPEMGRAGRMYIEEHFEITKLNDQLVDIYQQQLDSNIGPELCSSPVNLKHT